MKITKEQLKKIIKEELEDVLEGQSDLFSQFGLQGPGDWGAKDGPRMKPKPKEPKEAVFPSLPGSDSRVVDALNAVIEFSGTMAANFPRLAEDLYNLGVASNDIQEYYQLFWPLKGEKNVRLEAFLHDLIQFMEGR